MNETNQQIKFDHLESHEFENYCFDLLTELGFEDVNWRKGTGKNSSPADQGRDLEASLLREDIDESTIEERWFFECKHYKKGVPPTELQSILTSATAHRPDRVQIIVSNFLSNPAKNYLKEYRNNNNPPFKISYWERPNLEKLTFEKPRLIKKYNLLGGNPLSTILHPSHIEYLKHTKPNTLDYFLDLLKHFNCEEFKPFLLHVGHEVIKPRYRKPKSRSEKIGDTLIDDVNFETLQEKCISLSKIVDESFIVASMVNRLLQGLLKSGDIFSIEEDIEFYEGMIESLKSPPPKIFKEYDLETNNEKMIKMYEGFIENKPDDAQKYYELYNRFCDEVVSKLISEDLPNPTLKDIELILDELQELPE